MKQFEVLHSTLLYPGKESLYITIAFSPRTATLQHTLNLTLAASRRTYRLSSQWTMIVAGYRSHGVRKKRRRTASE